MNDSLPPLPESFCYKHDGTCWPDTFSAGQMKAYARAAIELQSAAPQPHPVQEPVAWQSIESMAAERYKVVLSHQSMFYRYAVVAGNGAQQLYIGRETECANMARKFAGAFLDGAHVVRYLNNTSPQAQPLSDDASPISVLLAVEESIKNGECPWQIEQAFDEYEAQRQSETTKGTT